MIDGLVGLNVTVIEIVTKLDADNIVIDSAVGNTIIVIVINVARVVKDHAIILHKYKKDRSREF